MQNQEFFAKLTQARQAQILALQRFAQAQARLAQLEARQQTLRMRLGHTTPSPEHEASSPNVAMLPESGELELREHFTPPPQTEQEKTERIVTRPAEASQ